MNAAVRWFVAACFCLLIGCGGDPEVRLGALAGKVTWQGKPVATGRIAFFPIGSADAVGSSAEIRDGSYSLPVSTGLSAGTYRVEIVSERPTGKQIPDFDGAPGAMKDEIINELPAKFNSRSKLTLDFDPDVNHEKNFELTP
jgi:hypothetical protein